jgi:Domain of unknown function (DUF6046)
VANIFEIEKLFNEAFGYNSKAFEFAKKVPNAQYAKLGSAYYAKDAKGREYYLPVMLGGVQLPYPVISIRSSKTIVDTPMVERDGSVYEGISMDDYMITIRGVMVGANNSFPEDDITKLKELWEKKESVQIRNVLTDIFLKGENKVIIKSLELGEMGGTKHVRSYQMELVSDMELELEIA